MRYKISDLAKLLGVSTNTVRRYEDMGYISAVRDENSGYRYYDDDGVFGVLNAKMHIKYGFTHEQISKLQNYTLDETIEACQERMQQLDKQIAYMTYLRHRLKDDCLLMNKAASNTDIYEVYITDAREDEEEADTKKVKSFILKLEEGTDFVMSFKIQ